MSQADILKVLNKGGEKTAIEIAEKIKINTPNVTRGLNILLKNNEVVKTIKSRERKGFRGGKFYLNYWSIKR